MILPGCNLLLNAVSERQLIQLAMTHWTNNTCIRFRQRRNELDYINIFPGDWWVHTRVHIRTQGGKTRQITQLIETTILVLNVQHTVPNMVVSMNRFDALIFFLW